MRYRIFQRRRHWGDMRYFPDESCFDTQQFTLQTGLFDTRKERKDTEYLISHFSYLRTGHRQEISYILCMPLVFGILKVAVFSGCPLMNGNCPCERNIPFPLHNSTKIPYGGIWNFLRIVGKSAIDFPGVKR